MAAALELAIWDAPRLAALYQRAGRGDARARELTLLVEMTLTEVRRDGATCIACHCQVRRAVALTFLTAVDFEARVARRGVVCCPCADAHPERELMQIAARSLGDALAAEAAAMRPGATVVHAPGNA